MTRPATLRSDASRRPRAGPFPRPANDTAEELDELVAQAARGDRRAIGAIAIAFGPSLLGIARRETRHEEDAEDVVQDLFLHLVEGRAARFVPRRGRGLRWLGGLVRALARKRRSETPRNTDG